MVYLFRKIGIRNGKLWWHVPDQTLVKCTAGRKYLLITLYRLRIGLLVPIAFRLSSIFMNVLTGLQSENFS